VAGTMLGSEITKKYGEKGLPEDTITLTFKGSAGQSFGAFIPAGLTMKLIGDSNDFLGKGLSGGKITVHPHRKSTFIPEQNTIVGNVAFYGATSGEAYINGIAGERFCVRNSGTNVVVEGVGDHGCEYMTGGTVVVLGQIGKNFAAGMSGGVAFIFDESNNFAQKCNQEQVELDSIKDEADFNKVYQMLEKHVLYTNSPLGKRVLENWTESREKFIRVIPRDYLEMQHRIQRFEASGLSKHKAALAAFEESKKVVNSIKDGG
jgi:glutamate synthase domain-containing protein 3